MSQSVRVRFAPSPTGPLHIGGVRTALFNYLFAKKHKGTLILRIEDTDQGRFVEGAEKYIVESLQWCGIDFDESPAKGGNYGPYRQSERKAMYKDYAMHLINEGKAYYAFDTPEELDAMRARLEAEKSSTIQYDCHTRLSMKNSLTLTNEQTHELLNTQTPYVIRFKMPENFIVEAQDIIRGNVQVNTSTLDDKVLFKSDGMPTYHLANIVDDHLMEITHVIRGEEWLPSLPLHMMLYKAFNWSIPEFAHLPLILKPDGKGKLSKRDGDKGGFPVFPTNWKTAEGEIYSGYRESGYFPDAFINMLALLGWNPGGEQEIFTLQELSELFSLERAGKAGSRFDPDKARWFNQQYLKKKPDTELADLVLSQFPNLNEFKDKIISIIQLAKDRITFLHEIPTTVDFMFHKPQSFCDVTIKKKWKNDTAQIIESIYQLLVNETLFERNHLENTVKSFIESKELGFGQVMPGLRLVITGQGQGPDLFTVMEILGKEESLNRIHENVKKVSQLIS